MKIGPQPRIRQLKKRIIRISSHFGFQRAAMAGYSLGALLVGGIAIPSAVYAQILLAMFLVKLLQVTNLGAVNGYIISRYSEVDFLANGGTDAELHYLKCLLCQLYVLTAILALGSALFDTAHLPGLLTFAFVVPVFAIEPLLRVRRQFYWSLFVDAILATSLIGSSSYVLLFNRDYEEGPSPLIMFVALCGALAITIVWALWQKVKQTWSLRVAKGSSYWNLRDYFRLVRLGLPAYTGTLLFTLGVGADRLFLPLHVAEADTVVYFLGMQLTLGAMVFITASNFVSAIDIGQILRDDGSIHPQVLRMRLAKAFITFLGSYIMLIGLSWTLEHYFLTEYLGLTQTTMLLGIGLGFFFLAGAVTPILQYVGRQAQATVAMGAVVVLLFGHNISILYLMPHEAALLQRSAFTAAALSVYALFAVILSFNACRNSDNSSSDILKKLKL